LDFNSNPGEFSFFDGFILDFMIST